MTQCHSSFFVKRGEKMIDIEMLLKFIAILVAIWGGVKVIKEILDAINKRHDQVKKWESYDQQISEVKASIEELKTDQNAKIQQIQAEQCMQTYVLQAVLDGLHQLHCNGKVTEASNKLDKYINKQAHNQ